MSYDWVQSDIPEVVVEDQWSAFFGAKNILQSIQSLFHLIRFWFFADFPVFLCILKKLFKVLSTLSVGLERSIKFIWFDWVRKLNLFKLKQFFVVPLCSITESNQNKSFD